jgi:plastocyanin
VRTQSSAQAEPASASWFGRIVVLALAAAAAALAPTTAAWAGELTVTVADGHGRPVADAVVLVDRPGRAEAGPIRFPWPMVVEQRDKQFHPFVLIVPVGAEVAFPNHDPFQHHVYSFSPAKIFELKLYGHDETRRVRFDHVGVVSLGCNIHDNMTGFVRVVDTPYAAKTDARGEAVLHGVPDGPAQLAVWHPYLRGGRDQTRSVAVRPGPNAFSVSLDLKPAPIPYGDY